jgi:hypothetical protein
MCPKCNKEPLERLISRFSFLKGTEEKDDMGMSEMDETKVQRALSLLEREAEDMNEDDPRLAAHLVRRLFDATGMNLGSGIEEALRRMEAGEDSDKIVEEMGDILSEEDIFKAAPKAFQKGRREPPEIDETLYYL